MVSDKNKILHIDESHHALFARNDEWASISNIEPDDILALVRFVAENPDVVMDECSRENDIVDQIEKTIYTVLYKKLKDLQENRKAYLQEIEDEFSEYERKMEIG